MLAIDLDGALMYSRPFEQAHKEWFRLMAVLLNDDSINEYANLEDYFPKVHEVMERYLGNVSKENRIKFARTLYAMSTIACVKQEDLCVEFKEFLESFDNLALITTAPEDCVDPILVKLGCDKLFKIVYKSDMYSEPDKKEIFKAFIAKHGQPEYYIGDGDKNLATAKELGIKTISVNWVKKAEVKGDFDVQSVSELKDMLSQNEDKI